MLVSAPSNVGQRTDRAWPGSYRGLAADSGSTPGKDFIMTVQFRNREDTRRYAAAEDAYTSEGGYLALENEVPGKVADAGRESRELPHDFMETVGRYATGMRHVLTVVRGTHWTARNENPPAR
jgi:hypothetical protein